MTQHTYTQEQLDIALLKQKNDEFHRNFDHIYKILDKIESNQRWILGLMGSGFLGVLGLLAHGFKLII